MGGRKKGEREEEEDRGRAQKRERERNKVKVTERERRGATYSVWSLESLSRFSILSMALF